MIIGWREWVVLPELGIPGIKAKVDTGAKTSALHTFNVEVVEKDGREFARFLVHPDQQRDDLVLSCEAPVIDKRPVRDSGGHVEDRYVIETLFELGGKRMPIEMTLTNRDDMLFRMLLGRSALVKAGFTVNPDLSYAAGDAPADLAATLEELSQ